MPQMAPLMWINLFIMFSTTFLLMSSLNYFSFLYKSKSSKINQEKTFTNWKW